MKVCAYGLNHDIGACSNEELQQITELQQENTKLKNDLRIQEAKVSKLEDDIRRTKSSPALSSSGGASGETAKMHCKSLHLITYVENYHRC